MFFLIGVGRIAIVFWFRCADLRKKKPKPSHYRICKAMEIQFVSVNKVWRHHKRFLQIENVTKLWNAAVGRERRNWVWSFLFIFIWGGEFATLCRISGQPGVEDGAIDPAGVDELIWHHSPFLLPGWGGFINICRALGTKGRVAAQSIQITCPFFLVI